MRAVLWDVAAAGASGVAGPSGGLSGATAAFSYPLETGRVELAPLGALRGILMKRRAMVFSI